MANVVIVPPSIGAGELSRSQYKSGNHLMVSGTSGGVIGSVVLPSEPEVQIPAVPIDHFYDYQQWYADGFSLVQEITFDMILKRFINFSEFRDALTRDFKGTILVQKHFSGWRLCLCNQFEQSQYPIWFTSFNEIFVVSIPTKHDDNELQHWLKQNFQGPYTVGRDGWGTSANYSIRCRLESDAALVKLRFG